MHTDSFWKCCCSRALTDNWTEQGYRDALLNHDLEWLREHGIPMPPRERIP